MKRPRKWEAGPVVHSYSDFEAAALKGRAIYVRGKRYNGRWAANLPFMFVARSILTGQVRLGVQRQEYRDWLRSELLGEDRDAARRVGPDYDEWVETDYEIVDDDEPTALRRLP